MVQEKHRMHVRWQVYEFAGPGLDFPRWAVAASLKRAFELALREDDILDTGKPLIGWNVTGGFLTTSDLMSRHTWEMLREAREGLLFYDYKDGWLRIEHP